MPVPRARSSLISKIMTRTLKEERRSSDKELFRRRAQTGRIRALPRRSADGPRPQRVPEAEVVEACGALLLGRGRRAERVVAQPSRL